MVVMEEDEKRAADQGTPTAAVPADGGKRRRLPLFGLAAGGALVAAAAVYMAARQPVAITQPAVQVEPAKPAPAPVTRAAIDETATIGRVMAENYGKYSEKEQGWPYVAEDGGTYVMRVVQQARLTDGAAGDELYFLVGGDVSEGEPSGKLGAFHVRPDPDKPGTLLTIGLRDMATGVDAPSAENMRFVTLSSRLRAWIISVRSGIDGEDYLTENQVVLAPDGKRIVALATFPAWRGYDAGDDCERVREEHAAALTRAATARETQGLDEAARLDETRVDTHLCQQRTWTYRIGTSKDDVPAPISVTAGGTLDGKPVPAKTWRLVFDPKAFRYQVPSDLNPGD
jgi:hypothetical protein